MSAEEMFRGFISVDLAGRLALDDVSRALKMLNIQQKLVEPENIHISLKFLGDTPEWMANDILGKMRAATEGVAPFDVVFRGLGAFPKLDKPRVIWIGVDAPQVLGQIAGRLEEGCADLGFKKEDRGFSPHITLSRVKFVRDRRGLPELFKQFQQTQFGTVHVEAIRLKKSVLGPRGPTYTTVGEIVLSGSRP